MEILQKRMANHIRFEFEDAALRYWIRDNSGEREMRVDYANIPKETRRVFERNNWLRNVGLMWCALGVIMLGLAAAASRATLGSAFWLFIGASCLGFYKLTQTNYTVIDTDQGSIWVIENAQAETVLKELRDRRKTRLMSLYGSFNPDNDRTRELQKYDWLVEQQVLTREEADKLIAAGQGEGALLPSPKETLH